MNGAAGGPAECEGMEQEHNQGQHQGPKVLCRPEPRED